VGAGEHNSPFKIMGVVNFAIAYTPLLDGMKNSPMFRNLVQVDLKEDAREVHDPWLLMLCVCVCVCVCVLYNTFAMLFNCDLVSVRCWMRFARSRLGLWRPSQRKTTGALVCALRP
jgi:hypothetical protein